MEIIVKHGENITICKSAVDSRKNEEGIKMNLKKIMSGAAAFMMTASLMTSYPTGCFKGLVAPVSVGAEERIIDSGTCGDNLTWKLTDDGVLTISGSGEMKRFSIYYNDAWREFAGQINKVIIENGVTSIGDYAFYDCTEMREVLMSDSVKNIGIYSFGNCSDLSEIILPASVTVTNTSRFNNSFYNCNSITDVLFNSYDSKNNVDAIKKSFGSDSIINYTYTGSCGPNATFTLDSDGNLVISGSGDISSNAFQDWTNITKVVIGDEITSIGNRTFDGCTKITEVKIGEKVTTISDCAFQYCQSLKEIVIPNSVKSVARNIFFYCSELSSITAPCKIKDQIQNRENIITYTHPNINEKCECNDCHETFHVDTDKNCICDECNTEIEHDTTANPNKCAVCGTEFVYITANGEKTRYTFGETVTITAPTAETGMTFDCWTAPNGKVVSRDAEYTFNAVVDNTYTPNYTPSKSSETMTIVWLSAYGQEMKRVTDTEDNLKSVEEPNVPTRLGYETTGWEKKTADIPFESGTTVIINAVYKELPQTYKINVTNGTADKTEYTAAQVATITADEKAGQKFSYWQEENGNIVSYSSTYKFYVSKNMKLTAVYDIVVEEPKGTADIVQKTYSNATNKISIVSQLTVPDGCTMVYAGLVGTLDESIAKDLNKGNAKYIKGSTNTSYKSLRYTWTVGKAKDVTVYVKAYLTYTDSNGKLHEVYGKTYKCVGSEEVELIEY